MRLLINNKRADDENDGGGKLKYNQPIPQDRVFASPAQLAFQYIDRFEGR